MAAGRTNEKGPISPYWWLLLLLLFPLIGWALGQMPVARQEQTSAAAAPEVTRGPGRVAPPPTEGAPTSELSEWTTFESAVAESQQNGKPVLIDFSADWCGPCQALRRLVFEDRARGRAVQAAVIPVSAGDRTPEGGSNPPGSDQLQQRHQVEAFPTPAASSPAT